MTTGQIAAASTTQAYAYIKNRIVSGEYASGMRLTEEQLARDLGTSRTPVREAMRLLVSDGFLDFKPNSGTFVRTWDDQEVSNIYDARMLIESEMAASAARNITRAQCDELSAIQDEIESNGPDISAENLERINPLNRNFHRLIGAASNNARLMKMLNHAIEVQIVQKTFSRYSPAQLSRSFNHHRELIDAFYSNDADWARATMVCHMRSGKIALLGLQSASN